MIRPITSEELWLTEECARGFFKESGLPGELQFEYWCSRWKQLIEILDIGVILAYFNEQGYIKGLIGGLCVPCTMTSQMEAIESFWYIMPEFRGGPIGVKLLKSFEGWADERGASRVKMAYLTHVNPVSMAGMYARMGYNTFETCVSKELTT